MKDRSNYFTYQDGDLDFGDGDPADDLKPEPSAELSRPAAPLAAPVAPVAQPAAQLQPITFQLNMPGQETTTKTVIEYLPDGRPCAVTKTQVQSGGKPPATDQKPPEPSDAQ